MPFVSVKVAGSLDAAQAGRLRQGVTSLMAEVLGKRADLTAVLVEPVAGGWAVGAEPVVRAAHLDATVTLGTNTAAEKARFVAAAHALLAEVLGPDLPLPTYVVVSEVPGEAWGYGGRTQADRAQARAWERDAGSRSAPA